MQRQQGSQSIQLVVVRSHLGSSHVSKVVLVLSSSAFNMPKTLECQCQQWMIEVYDARSKEAKSDLEVIIKDIEKNVEDLVYVNRVLFSIFIINSYITIFTPRMAIK